MDYKKFTKSWIFCVVCAFSVLSFFLVVIDPIGIIGFPEIKGINSFKSREGRYFEISKPHQVTRLSPKVVFIGSSRVYTGLNPTFPGYEDTDVYNLGCNTIPLKNAEQLLDLVYSNNKPEVVVIGLDFFQFSVESYENVPSGYSLARLKNLENSSDVKRKFEAFKDSFQIFSTIVPTIKDSRKYKNEEKPFIRGWNRGNGELRVTHKPSFYSDLNSYSSRYNNFVFDERSIQCLERIAEKAKKNNVKLYVFFNPLVAELRGMIYSLGLDDEMRMIKTRVANIFGTVYDFDYASQLTCDRRNYIDASHYHDGIGEIMKSTMLSEKSSDICMVLEPENVEALLSKEDEAYHKWAYKNKDYVNELARKTCTREAIVEGEFDKYLEM